MSNVDVRISEPGPSMGPLAAWNDGATRKAIIDFVGRVVDPESSDFVKAADRIAVFDNDGTLWCEQPLIQGMFIMQRLAKMAKDDESLRTQQPWKAAYENDSTWINQAIVKHYGGDDSDLKVLLQGSLKAFSNTDVETFATAARTFLDAAQHPTYKRSVLEVTYVPMVELLTYLHEHEFTVYMCTGGGRDFIRPVSEQLYGIPPECVIGSTPKMTYQADGAQVIRNAGLGFMDDGPEKAIHIWEVIGRRPILVGGNANGDVPMMEFGSQQDGLTLCLVVQHDDEDREFAYNAGAENAVAVVKKNGWTVISIKDDWNQVFSFQPVSV